MWRSCGQQDYQMIQQTLDDISRHDGEALDETPGRAVQLSRALSAETRRAGLKEQRRGETEHINVRSVSALGEADKSEKNAARWHKTPILMEDDSFVSHSLLSVISEHIKSLQYLKNLTLLISVRENNTEKKSFSKY